MLIRFIIQDVLTEHKSRPIEVCGSQIEFCVDTTIKMAYGLGYCLEMVWDLTTSASNQIMSAQQTINFLSISYLEAPIFKFYRT